MTHPNHCKKRGKTKIYDTSPATLLHWDIKIHFYLLCRTGLKYSPSLELMHQQSLFSLMKQDSKKPSSSKEGYGKLLGESRNCIPFHGRKLRTMCGLWRQRKHEVIRENELRMISLFNRKIFGSWSMRGSSTIDKRDSSGWQSLPTGCGWFVRSTSEHLPTLLALTVFHILL